MVNTTPGPWYAANMGNDHQGLIIAEGSGVNVAVSYDRQDANLIAAAPDLLEALKLAQMWIHRARNGENIASIQFHDSKGEAWKQIRDAIEKAEGL